MDNLFPISPGASCDSSYSDITSGSVFSDAVEPVSPDYHLDNPRTQLSVQSSASSASSDIPAEDSIPEENKTALADFHFYQTLNVGSPEAVRSHLEHLINKYNVGRLGLPSKNTTPGSLTPYSDIAQPKKRNREGGVKRPMNAFMCFAKAERGHLMAGQPELHNARISQHLGDVWKQCPDALKTPYIDMAQWLKELHRLEHPEYKYRPRKRKASGNNNNNNNSKKNENNNTLPVSDAAAAEAEGYVLEDLAKPAKRTRKSGTRAPRSRASRKPSGQLVQLVPPLGLVEAPLVNTDVNDNDVLAQVELEVAAPMPAPAPVAAPAAAAPAVVVAAQLGAAAEQQQQQVLLPEDNWQGFPAQLSGIDSLDFMFDPDQDCQMTMDSDFMSDSFGFSGLDIGSDKLLQGPQVEAALDTCRDDLDFESFLKF